MGDKHNDIYKKTLIEVKEFLRFAESFPNIQRKEGVNMVYRAWLERNAIATDEIKAKNNARKENSELPGDAVVINFACISSKLQTFARVQHIYSIISDTAEQICRGSGTLVATVDDCGKCAAIPSQKLTLYYGELTNKWKRIQKLWHTGDIRGIKSIDESIYKNYYDPANGKVPGKPLAAILLANHNHPGQPLYVHGLETLQLSPWDQMCFKQLKINYVY